MLICALARMSFIGGLGGQKNSFRNETYPNHVTVFSMSPRKKNLFFFNFSWVFLGKGANCLECWLGVYGDRCFHNGLPWAHMQIPITESQGGGGRLWLASLRWSPPLSASACFPTSSEYIIMTLPVVLWIPDLKGQRQLSVETLSQSNSNGRGRRILNRPGPSLPSKEEALGDEEILPKGDEEIHAPNNCLPLSKFLPLSLTGRLPKDLPPRTQRGMERYREHVWRGQTEDIPHSLRFQSWGYNSDWAPSELYKNVLVSTTSVTSAFWYKENILNRSFERISSWFLIRHCTDLLSRSHRSGNNLEMQSIMTLWSVLEILLTPGCL